MCIFIPTDSRNGSCFMKKTRGRENLCNSISMDFRMGSGGSKTIDWWPLNLSIGLMNSKEKRDLGRCFTHQAVSWRLAFSKKG